MLKTTLFIAALSLFASGCRSSRPGASRKAAAASESVTRTSGGVQFIDNISVNPSGKDEGSTGGSGHPHVVAGPESNGSVAPGSIEEYKVDRFKFAILENASVEDMNNPKLLSFMDYWYGAPYRYGGMSRDGIDCSAFSFLLMSSVYGLASMPRTSKEQYLVSRHIRRDELQEGDLVFFHTLGRRRAVTHVGVYLRNNKFIHASLSGVMISDLSEHYYSQHYVGAGRVLNAGNGDAADRTGTSANAASRAIGSN
ncbi:MAG TPA: C40 family peptidase [Puia sp.]|nr:C40 family peptidase [Puia sp.]